LTSKENFVVGSRKSYRIGPEIENVQPAYLFPIAGDYIIYSKPLFRVKRGEEEELVECEAQMRVSLQDAAAVADGTRQISFKVLEWEAVGNSKLLGGELKYSLLKSLKSQVTAGSEVADLPGRMIVSGRFGAFLNGEIVDEHKGKAVGVISSFPPAKGDLFDISGSRINLGNISIEGIVCKCAN